MGHPSTAARMVRCRGRGVRTAANGTDLYVHVFNWPAAPLQINAKVLSARLLATNQPLTFLQSEKDLAIQLTSESPDPYASVIALRTL